MHILNYLLKNLIYVWYDFQYLLFDDNTFKKLKY